MLELKGVSKSFGGLRVLKDVNLNLGAGEILGLIGPNGAGKTTLFNIISGQLIPDAGQVLYENKLINKMSASERVKKIKLGRTFQIVRPFLDLTCEENVWVGLQIREISNAQKRELSHYLLAMVGLFEKRSIESRNLTLIEKKKLELARALAIEPKIILLDEVMSGLNPNEVNEAKILIQKLNQELKVTVFWIEHLVRAVAEIATRMVVLHQGVIIQQGLPRVVLQDKQVIEAYLGEDYE